MLQQAQKFNYDIIDLCQVILFSYSDYANIAKQAKVFQLLQERLISQIGGL